MFLVVFLSVLLLTQVLSDWSFLIPSAEAASLGVRPSAPSTMTFQQFLKEGQRSTAYHGPLIAPSARPLGPGKGALTNYATLPPNAEPATMKPITQAL